MNVNGLVVMAGALAVSVTCAAQDKGQLRNQAKTMAEQLRRAGEPIDRCSLGARLVDGGIVTSVSDGTPLRPGDRLLKINQVDVSGKSADQTVSVLRGIKPGSSIEVEIERSLSRSTIKMVCENSRPFIETILAGLDAAARGKFEECVAAFSRRSDLAAFGVGMKLQCAAVAKNPNELNLANLAHEAARQAISEAYWAPSIRPAVIIGLRQSEGLISRQLGDARFQELVSATEKWPGGEDMFSRSEPDMVKFREVAEQAVRSRLIDPDSARIEWPFGFLSGSWKPAFQKKIDGYWTCGLVNAKNRMGGYTGRTSFVAVVSPAGLIQYVELGTGKDFDLLSSQCANSVKLLPPAPPEFSAGYSSATPSAGGSMADELKKLAELRQSGALTESEFQAAKQRLLGAPANP